MIETAGTARAGDIILLHEGQQWTMDALPEIVGGLRSRGLDCCTVSDLMQGAVR
jgi:peptidoglycan-N-acetylglucosamine deacetylase